MDAAHKKSPPDRQAVFDNVPDKEDRGPGSLRDVFGRRTRRRFIHTEVRVVTSRPDEDRDLVPSEPHCQSP